MKKIDLNIDNYSLEDILSLFNIDYNFDENDMKNAKKIVLQSHPDKSNLDKEYFLFFTKAYKYLFFIYDFRKKKYEKDNNVNDNNVNDNNLNHNNVNHNNVNHNNVNDNIIINNNKYTNIISDEERKNNYELLKNTKEVKSNFNEWFNKMFDEHNLDTEYKKDGYGEWLNDDNNFKMYQNCNNVSRMNETIREIKDNNYSVVKREDFDDNMSRINNAADLLNDKLDDYSSAEIFSKFGYNDIKKAHNESLIPVSESIKRQEFNSIGEYEIFRKQEQLKNKNYTLEESKNILNNKKNNLNIIDNQRAFKLAKQDEEIEKMNNIFWSKIKLLNS